MMQGQKGTAMKPNSAIPVLAIVLAFCGGAIVTHQVRTRPVPFDMQAWREDVHGETAVRYRMWPEVRRMLGDGTIRERTDVVRVLGYPDPLLTWESQREADLFRYPTQRTEPSEGLWYIMFQFDPAGRIIHYGLYPG
jgi:hypothetical protein